jgi:hypothetical protein
VLPSPPAPLPCCPHPRPLSRAALTPGPSPALRERGELGRERGIVDSRRRRIAIAPLMPPPSARLVGAEGSRGKGEGGPHPQPLSRAAGEG